MIETVIDIETTSFNSDPSPYIPENYIVSVGTKSLSCEEYVCFNHTKQKATNNAKNIIQDILDKTDILVGHNIKFDLSWLLECGFKYDGKIYDTMIYEYLKAGGLKQIRLDLSSCCRRYNIAPKRDLTQEYLDVGIGFESIPWDVVEDYGKNDVNITWDLYQEQKEELDGKLVSTMNDMCRVLIDMERAGIRIDTEALNKLERDYTKELKDLTIDLEEYARNALGDTPFKLTSNDDLSMLIFSRRPYSKKKWAEVFNLGTEVVNGTRKPKRPVSMGKSQLSRNIEEHSFAVYKTTAQQCNGCKGTGKVSRKRKDGTWGSPHYKCNLCNGCGIYYETDYSQLAGFQQLPSSINDLAAHGYSCSKSKLEELARSADGEAKQFLSKLVRFNAVSHYLTSFIKGIKENIKGSNVLHTQFMQCVTSTGRLSSRSPNFHNQPRGETFPIRRVIISRWDGGTITEADYAQLEFRVAAALSKDEVALQDILNGVDAHGTTAELLTGYGQPTTRQEAKTHTFKPLYGGTSGTDAEQAYYRDFLRRYKGIAEWHKKLVAISTKFKSLSLPTGREYRFPWAIKNERGYISGTTKIKNYPVQGFATADIVPIATINLYNLMKKNKVKSLIINEVHDSIVVDTYPKEEGLIAKLMCKAMLGVIDTLKEDFNYTLGVPLEVEVKNGTNWLSMEKIRKETAI